eukprot:2306909-Pyramimonas_sp.AAC.1
MSAAIEQGSPDSDPGAQEVSPSLRSRADSPKSSFSCAPCGRIYPLRLARQDGWKVRLRRCQVKIEVEETQSRNHRKHTEITTHHKKDRKITIRGNGSS